MIWVSWFNWNETEGDAWIFVKGLVCKWVYMQALTLLDVAYGGGGLFRVPTTFKSPPALTRKSVNKCLHLEKAKLISWTLQ